jgi:hypothetical protein
MTMMKPTTTTWMLGIRNGNCRHGLKTTASTSTSRWSSWRLFLIAIIGVLSSSSSFSRTKTTTGRNTVHYSPTNAVHGLNIVIPGGTGRLGRLLLPQLAQHDVTVLSRNAYLASAPNRVTGIFGYLGAAFLERNQHVRPIRDWDGGDLLEIVGKDFIGWQEDTLVTADVVVHLVGGYSQQRKMATERIVKESLTYNPNALHITVNPIETDIGILSPGLVGLKCKRVQECEDIVKQYCANVVALRLEAYREDVVCTEICNAINSWNNNMKIGQGAGSKDGTTTTVDQDKKTDVSEEVTAEE